ncbi:GNAT family N-acetyltransferase [Desulfuromonas carbonis]|uniref:lysophospholipid acyltransferase family protein n=1 Tax=Desulfuromonas sp. DDH964 TaxID=1823759 RepID=UPI00078D9893|nr:lysophospholipid acyltransferase family protein [Desulfuromonas sp. DDH964]AMV73693.1 2-acylglycerophosphoethanolamine acyltransferase [Desulfuromonas sp. DDH964]
MPQVPELTSSPFTLPHQWRPVAPIARRLLALDRCQEIYAGLPADLRGAEFISRLLGALSLRADCTRSDRERIPAQGGLLVIANHPFGAAEGLLLAHQLLQVRSDVRILANHLLNRIPQLKDLLIAVDPFGGPGAAPGNRQPLRQALRWLKEGGVLVVFPAGEVSHLQVGRNGVSDPPWAENLAGLVRCSGVPVLPVWFGGGNGATFQLAGLLHRRLRTALLPRQLLNKRCRTLPMRIGGVIGADKLAGFSNDAALVDYLRLRTYLLGSRSQPRSGERGDAARPQAPLVPARIPEALAAEVAALGAEQRLTGSGELEVYLADARQIPQLLLEIGRLREVTFRAVGEGTGRELDLDEYDNHYQHLFLWNARRREVAGAYRIGRVDPQRGLPPERFYTHTLFRYGAQFLERLGPALELGRSFVRPEYQRQFAPLLLLWKGIGAFLVRNPHYRALFGPVSISQDYSQLSKELLTDALRVNCFSPDLARLVAPRTPIRLQPPAVAGCDRGLLQALGRDLAAVEELIAEIEPGPGGIPVLLRHYLGLGGRVLAFNLDKEFSDVVDALVVVDLNQTDFKTLTRYLGREGAATFRDYPENHGGGHAACA